MNYNHKTLRNNNLFEIKVQNYLEQTRMKIWNKTEIQQYYGTEMSEINHMIFTSDRIICFTDKLTDNMVSTSCIKAFIRCVNMIAQHNNIYTIGVYIGNISLNNPSKIELENENNKCNGTHFHTIIELNEDVLLNKIHNYLHSYYNIYMYDMDGDCFMLNC